MSAKKSLPESLTRRAFRVCEAPEAGISRGRLRASDLTRPARGIVLPESAELDLSDVEDRCRALAPILNGRQFFTRRTAAELWKIPVPATPAGLIEIGSFSPARAPRRPEILGHRVRAGIMHRSNVNGLPTPAVADIWCLLAAVLNRDELVVAGDAILTPRRRFRPGGGRYPALATLAEVSRAVERHRGGAGASLREHALSLLRSPVDSPPETLLRLRVIDAGFPEPLVNCPVPVFGQILHSDLGYPEMRIAIEYEGAYHFEGGVRQSRADVWRWEAMVDAKWRVLRATALDLADPREFLGRLERAIDEARAR